MTDLPDRHVAVHGVPANGGRNAELRLQRLVLAAASWVACTILLAAGSGSGLGVYLLVMVVAGVLFAGAAWGRIGLAAPVLLAGGTSMLSMAQHSSFWWPAVVACVLVVIIAECCASFRRLRTIASLHRVRHEQASLVLQAGVATVGALAAGLAAVLAAGWYVLSAGVAVALVLVAVTALRPPR
jgi:hypothetical protein